MNIMIANFKKAEFNSHETMCYRATVLVDGRALCTASNEGHGGCDMFEPVEGVTYAEMEEKIYQVALEANPNTVRTHAEKVEEDRPWPYPDDWYRKFSMTSHEVFEALLAEEIDRLELTRQVRNDLRHRWVVLVDGVLKTYGKRQKALKGLPEDRARAQVLHHAGGGEILNDRPLEEVLPHYRAEV